MRPKKREEATYRFEVTGELDPHALEALHLEVRRLAARLGAEITEWRVENAQDEASGDSS